MTGSVGRRARRRRAPTPDQIELVARRFRVLAEPVRLQLLQALMSGERAVGDLATTLGLSQANTSKHLQVLLVHGVVGRRKDGLFAHYRIVDESVFDLCDMVCGRLAQASRTGARIFTGR